MIELGVLTRVDLLLFFAIGVLGGVHCIGMCGPIVTMYDGAHSSGQSTTGVSTESLYYHGLFNLGRTASYTLLGALFGTIGGLVYLTMESLLAVANPIRGTVGVALGLVIIAHGVATLIGRHTFDLHRLPIPNVGLKHTLQGAANRVRRIADGPGIVGLGLAHGLVPCPMLYAAFVYAFAVGSPVLGAASLAALGLGTFPAVFLYGITLNSLGSRHASRLHRVLGVAFVVLGYVLLAHGLMAVGIHLPHPDLPHYLPPELSDAGHHSHE
ncbi:sulfite exporter TauE/SafE family protein [Natronolimnohabitans sp. A-GB9]|uniref:sulfite exporter TauE/SafE family protein n=1 Tax=Natronolimnohabitans sp. A-GB9 TaxID=3069757 RepID=UPI0027AF1CD1|nr:sulfite exporter TauE/SafE family protein [Natronolimnohabitans sp. A-GB9]MDQ2051141.1 sulfite exporter TauE/SafE family protein [Natronolimnohabitans sp. A-GB9]